MAKLKEEFLVFFIEEVQDILDRLEQIMINFEHTTLDEELNKLIKRDFHTLKGDFLTYNFKKYSEYFHKVEDLWEIEEFRPFTAETILKNITEVRNFLKITQNNGLEEAFNFEEKSHMLEELNEENLKNIKEIGKEFSFILKGLFSTKPKGWEEMKKIWFLSLESKELEDLRKSYGLSGLKKGNKFHITVGVERK